MAEIINNVNRTEQDEIEYEKACARYDALSEYQKKRISERRDSMENAMTNNYDARYSRFFASWFNTHPHAEVRTTLREFEEYLEHTMLDEWERGDIHQMLTCGKSEIENNIKKYEEDKKERENKSRLIRVLKDNGVEDPGLENLSVETLRQIEASIIRKHIGVKEVTDYSEKELQLISDCKRIKEIKGIDCAFNTSVEIHIERMGREALEFAKKKERHNVKKALDAISEYRMHNLPEGVILSTEIQDAIKDAYKILLTF